eukprot:c36288_g1_i1 orf=7-156(-)
MLEECIFLGGDSYSSHIIPKDGIKMDPAKVDAIKNWPEMKIMHDLWSFL